MPRIWLRRGLWTAAAGVGVTLLALTASLAPLWTSALVDEHSSSQEKVPDFTYEPWYGLAVQDGRTKPFQTVCIEAVRQITGASRFEGLDPVAVVLAWMLCEGGSATPGGAEWETYPFILCDHHALRRQIMEPADGQQADDAKPHGRFVSPAELRRSPAFDRLLEKVGRKRKELQGKAHLELTTEHLKAEEVGRRLLSYDTLCGKTATRLFKNALVGDAFVDLGEAASLDVSPEQALAALAGKQTTAPDRIHLVGLDQTPGSSWFSLGDLRAFENNPRRWQRVLADRVPDASARQPYPQAEIETVLQGFADVRAAYRSGKTGRFDDASRGFFALLRKITDERAAAAVGETYPGVATIPWELGFNRWQPFRWAWIVMLAALLLLALGAGLGRAKGNLPSPPVLRGRGAGGEGGEPAANSTFREAFGPPSPQPSPPGVPGGEGDRNGVAHLCYRAGLCLYVGSLALQTVGFSLRMAISGRAPVSNMYESVIFAAFMAAVFALILEWVYRRGPIALTGAALAVLGLVLADQLPLTLDPKISPIVPVLRTNYWLTIHVLTITSSYAAGALAWGLGNLTLGLLVFGTGNPDALKTLAHYTYRALQIAVLLLAAGTFLGGWWAADAWGRFWGWDPKEVGALIALVSYVIPLHARYLGWLRDFGLAVCAVLCFASILLSWYVVNFLVASGLHSYGFSAGGGAWILWACLLNIEWVLVAAIVHQRRQRQIAVS